MKKILALTVLLCLAIPTLSFSQQSLTKAEKIEALYNANKKRVETKNYSFEASWVFGDNIRKDISAEANSITINQSNVYGAMATTEVEKPSVMLKGAMQNYTVNFNDDKHTITIAFKTGSYNAEISVLHTGISFLKLTKNQKTITYKGLLK